LPDAEARLRELEPRRDLAVLREDAARNRDNALLAASAQRLTTADSIDSLSDKEFMYERQIDEQKRQITEQEKLLKSAATASGPAPNSAYGVLLARRAEVEGQIKNLATSATEKNPKMIQARAQLAAVNKEIARIEADGEANKGAGGANNGEAADPASPEARELRAMRRDLQRLETELEVTRRDLGRKTRSLNALPSEKPEEPSSSGKFDEAKTDYNRLMGRYNWLMDKQESLQKLSGDEGQKMTMFQVIDAPLAQAAPVAPNRMFLRLAGLGIAL